MPANCYYIILIIAHLSSILSMLSNLLPVFTYKDTTLKAVCQVLDASFIHLIFFHSDLFRLYNLRWINSCRLIYLSEQYACGNSYDNRRSYFNPNL